MNEKLINFEKFESSKTPTYRRLLCLYQKIWIWTQQCQTKSRNRPRVTRIRWRRRNHNLILPLEQTSMMCLIHRCWYLLFGRKVSRSHRSCFGGDPEEWQWKIRSGRQPSGKWLANTVTWFVPDIICPNYYTSSTKHRTIDVCLW